MRQRLSPQALVNELQLLVDEVDTEARKPVLSPLEVAEKAIFDLLWSRSQSLEKAIERQSEPLFSIRAQSDSLWILERALEIVRQAQITGEQLSDGLEQQEFQGTGPKYEAPKRARPE